MRLRAVIPAPITSKYLLVGTRPIVVKSQRLVLNMLVEIAEQRLTGLDTNCHVVFDGIQAVGAGDRRRRLASRSEGGAIG